jgi:hypothetical protein
MGIEPTPRVMRDTGFEDQGGHQTPNASKMRPGLWKTPAKKHPLDKDEHKLILASPCPKDISCRGFLQPRHIAYSTRI